MKPVAPNTALRALVFLFLFFSGLYFAKPLLAPFTLAMLLSMMFYHIASRMEKKGVSRPLASLICVLMFAAVMTGIVWLVSNRINGISEDLPTIRANASELVDRVEGYINHKLNLQGPKKVDMLNENGPPKKDPATTVGNIFGKVSNVVIKFLLVNVYIFLLLNFRKHLARAIVAIAPSGYKKISSTIIQKSARVAAKYISGLSMMIVMLWIMYSIGFSIVGIDNAIFFAIICGLLETIPFVGNLVGTGLTSLMALSQGGGSMVLGVLATYGIIQFIQSYILQPVIVGSEVSINPLFTILAIVAGEFIWGVTGMIVAIPMLGIVKVICDEIEFLKPYGLLIGAEKKAGKPFSEKIRGWFKKRR